MEDKKTFECEILSDNLKDNLQFIQKSKDLAKSHEWLYHCTSAKALKSILKNREFWLSNLKTVNDKEETKRIDVPEYENKYYVCCFTYDPNIPDEHWKEYGSQLDGVLIGIKREWFLRKATFMCGDNTKCDRDDFAIIFRDCNEAFSFKMEELKKRHIINPFYINAFDFFQVIYDDVLKKNIVETGVLNVNGVETCGRVLAPEIAGIIKSTHGICQRSGKEDYDKNWESEKEVRLKVGIQQVDIFCNENKYHDETIMSKAFFPKIALPVSDEAFGVLKIAFSPKFVDRSNFLKELQELLPESSIEII